MEFEITHTTHYAYSHPVAEAYGEARLTPPNLASQTVLSHRIAIEPDTKTSAYTDHYGNAVNFFSLPYRHKKLTVTNQLVVETRRVERPDESLGLCVQEARQIFSSVLTDIFDYLQPTEIVEIGREAVQWARKYLRGDVPLGEGLQNLNEAIHDSFDYKKGSTDNSTSLSAIWKEKKGVCQDFTHVGLSILRTAGLPARYVCGYIETDPPRAGEKALTGAVATHAWIEVLIPGRTWVAIDPTNRQWCNERYVTVAYGRDFRDATPLRGRFKGAGSQGMSVKVLMKRRPEKNRA
jgi:transglutaminase-like putative cysteine protease